MKIMLQVSGWHNINNVCLLVCVCMRACVYMCMCMDACVCAHVRACASAYAVVPCTSVG